MSLFNQYKKTGSVYIYEDVGYRDISQLPGEANFEVSIHVIRRNETDSVIMGEQLGEYVANVGGKNASLIPEGAIIVIGNEKYQVTNKPKHVKLFNRYRLNLKPV